MGLLYVLRFKQPITVEHFLYIVNNMIVHLLRVQSFLQFDGSRDVQNKSIDHYPLVLQIFMKGLHPLNQEIVLLQ
ncbi:hypothetical protein ACH3XW_30345 [Acanthocheilonema viteae]